MTSKDLINYDGVNLGVGEAYFSAIRAKPHTWSLPRDNNSSLDIIEIEASRFCAI